MATILDNTGLKDRSYLEGEETNIIYLQTVKNILLYLI